MMKRGKKVGFGGCLGARSEVKLVGEVGGAVLMSESLVDGGV
jgi:hypothetical protein